MSNIDSRDQGAIRVLRVLRIWDQKVTKQAMARDPIGNAGRREQQTVMGSGPWATRARKQDGGHMLSSLHFSRLLVGSVLCLSAVIAGAQSFRVQCPTSTITHPNAVNNNSEPAYTGPTTLSAPSATTYQAP